MKFFQGLHHAHMLNLGDSFSQFWLLYQFKRLWKSSIIWILIKMYTCRRLNIKSWTKLAGREYLCLVPVVMNYVSRIFSLFWYWFTNIVSSNFWQERPEPNQVQDMGVIIISSEYHGGRDFHGEPKSVVKYCWAIKIFASFFNGLPKRVTFLAFKRKNIHSHSNIFRSKPSSVILSFFTFFISRLY